MEVVYNYLQCTYVDDVFYPLYFSEGCMKTVLCISAVRWYKKCDFFAYQYTFYIQITLILIRCLKR